MCRSTMKCNLIRFTQKGIGARFKSGESLSELVRQLLIDTDKAVDVRPLRAFFLNDLCFSLDNRRLACYFLTSSFLGRDFEVPVREVSVDSLSHFQLRKVANAAKSLQRCRGRFVRLRRPITIVGRRIHVVRTPKNALCTWVNDHRVLLKHRFLTISKKVRFVCFPELHIRTNTES